jgi:hypothetical protein
LPEAGPVRVWNPEGFDPENYLSEDMRRHGDCARYLVHRVAFAPVRDGRLRGRFVPLKAEYLRKFFPDPRVYAQVRGHLIGGGGILCDQSYCPGEKAMGYQLGPELSKMRCSYVAIGDARLARKIRQSREDAIDAPEAVHRYLLGRLREVEIEYDAAVESLYEAGDFKLEYDIALQAIRDRRFFFGVCRYGRVHHNLTNLRASLRPFLRHRGRPLVNLDVRNSQPLLFAVLLRERFAGRDLPADVRRYIELCQAGRFYDHLMEAWGIPPRGRGEFKASFYGRVFFCKNSPESETARRFGEMFPAVYGAVREMKADDHAALAQRLQRVESGLIIGRVASRCSREIPGGFISTIHDSVVTTAEHADTVRSIMLGEFAVHGLTPTIGVEDLDSRKFHKNISKSCSTGREGTTHTPLPLPYMM